MTSHTTWRAHRPLLLGSAAIMVALAIVSWATPAAAVCPCCSSIHDPGVDASVRSNGTKLQRQIEQNSDANSLLQKLVDGLGLSGSRLGFTAGIAPTVLPKEAGELIGPDGKPRADLASRAAASGSALLKAAFGGTVKSLADLPPVFSQNSGLDLLPSADAVASPAKLLDFARTELGVTADATQETRNKVQARRRVEYSNAIDTAWAVGVHHLDAARTAPERLDEATRSIDGATDLRAQMALNTQAVLSVVEQLERQNELLAALVRMQAAGRMASENLARHTYLGRPTVDAATGPMPWQGSTTQ